MGHKRKQKDKNVGKGMGGEGLEMGGRQEGVGEVRETSCIIHMYKIVEEQI